MPVSYNPSIPWNRPVSSGQGIYPGSTHPPSGAPPGSIPFPGSYGYSSGYGGIPFAPDPVTSGRQAIAGGIGSLGGLYGLSTGVSGASAAGAATQLGRNLPGYGGLIGQSSQNIGSELRGQIPTDVVNQLQTLAAERGVGFGPDSPNTNAALLRGLGLTSLGLTQQGETDLTRAIGRTPVGPAFNPASFVPGPGDVQNARLTGSIFGAAPVPIDAARAGVAASQGGFQAGLGGFPGGGGTSMASFNPPIPRDTGGPAIPGATDNTFSGPTPGGYQRWNDWFNSISNPSAGGSDTAGMGLSPEDEMFFQTYGMLPPGSESGSLSGPGMGLYGPPAPAGAFDSGGGDFE